MLADALKPASTWAGCNKPTNFFSTGKAIEVEVTHGDSISHRLDGLAEDGLDVERCSDIDFTHAFLCKSGDLISYLYCKANRLPLNCFQNIEELQAALPAPCCCSGTGSRTPAKLPRLSSG